MTFGNDSPYSVTSDWRLSLDLTNLRQRTIRAQIHETVPRTRLDLDQFNEAHRAWQEAYSGQSIKYANHNGAVDHCIDLDSERHGVSVSADGEIIRRNGDGVST